MQVVADAAERAVRGRLRTAGDLHQRGVQVFAQAMTNTFAVCGRATTSGGANEPLLPWVAVVSTGEATPQVTSFVLGASGPEATRVFIEMVDRCFEGGGPTDNRRAGRLLPPLPFPSAPEAPIPAATQPPDIPTAATGSAAAVRSVVTSSRTPANLRAAPQGGDVLRTVPRLSSLQVLGEAPGGWYQVGQNGDAWGWIHSSVLESPPR